MLAKEQAYCTCLLRLDKVLKGEIGLINHKYTSLLFAQQLSGFFEGQKFHGASEAPHL